MTRHRRRRGVQSQSRRRDPTEARRTCAGSTGTVVDRDDAIPPACTGKAAGHERRATSRPSVLAGGDEQRCVEARGECDRRVHATSRRRRGRSGPATGRKPQRQQARGQAETIDAGRRSRRRGCRSRSSRSRTPPTPAGRALGGRCRAGVEPAARASRRARVRVPHRGDGVADAERTDRRSSSASDEQRPAAAARRVTRATRVLARWVSMSPGRTGGGPPRAGAVEIVRRCVPPGRAAGRSARASRDLTVPTGTPPSAISGVV